MIQNAEKLRKAVEERLSAERCHHSLCVQRQAIRLARRWGQDWYRAGIAGLLHDISKCQSEEEQLKYLRGNGILLDELSREHPGIWHAEAGALYAKQELGVEDPAILSAIRFHAAGRAGMSPLEQIVFLADKTSEDRSFPDVDQARAAAERSLAEGMVYVLSFVVRSMAERGGVIVRDTWEAYNYFVKQARESGGKAQGGPAVKSGI